MMKSALMFRMLYPGHLLAACLPCLLAEDMKSACLLALGWLAAGRQARSEVGVGTNKSEAMRIAVTCIDRHANALRRRVSESSSSSESSRGVES
jgi:hypothetical protein